MEWQEIRRKAITLVEATNLLVMPGRIVARPEKNQRTPASSFHRKRSMPFWKRAGRHLLSMRTNCMKKA